MDDVVNLTQRVMDISGCTAQEAREVALWLIRGIEKRVTKADVDAVLIALNF